MLWEKLLDPAVLALSIPVLAVLLWGLASVIRAMRGDPEDFAEWQQELQDIKARVEKLEQAQQPTGQPASHR